MFRKPGFAPELVDRLRCHGRRAVDEIPQDPNGNESLLAG
jgi:hypothetical protein